MRGNDSLADLVAVLRSMGGYFVFDDAGEEFVVVSKTVFDRMREEDDAKKQLSLDDISLANVEATRSDADVLARINRDIALFAEQHREQTEELLEQEEEQAWVEGKRVRFEPIRGDLAPDLQD